MTKKICDRCGAEINPSQSANYAFVSDKPMASSLGFAVYIPKETELCVSCAYKLRQWLKGGTEE